MFGAIKDLTGWRNYKKLQRDNTVLKTQVMVQATVIQAKNDVIQQVMKDAAVVLKHNELLKQCPLVQPQPPQGETTTMASKFVSALEHIGKDVEHGLIKAAPIAAQLVGLFPGGGEIKTAVQLTTNAISIAQQSGQTSEQKLATVVSLAGPQIQEGLAKLGKSNTDVDIKNFINMLVEYMNFIPESAVSNLKTVNIGTTVNPTEATTV